MDIRLLASSAFILLSSQAFAADYYVDGKSGSELNPGTSAKPFLYFWQATKVVQPGDTVYVMPTTVYPTISITTSGTSSNPITIVGAGASPNLTQVSGGSLNFGFWINASYVVVENFDATGPGAWTGIYITEHSHNVTVQNNVVHNSGVGGIATFGADYVTIQGNTVYSNGQYTAGGTYGSGISLLGNLDVDSSTGVKMRVIDNVVYSNTNVPVCPSSGCSASTVDSDGNGIIVDDSRRDRWDGIVYHGRTLVANNIVFGNGGRGIHTYLSDHITITDNTLYYNNQDPYEANYLPGEVEVNMSGDTSVDNNVLYSDGGTGIDNGVNTGHHVGISLQHCSDGVGRLIAQNNVIYNPANNSKLATAAWDNSVSVSISGDIWGDPLLNNPSLYESVADFRPRVGSTTLTTGNMSTSMTYDILSIARTSPPTIGAYQKAVN